MRREFGVGNEFIHSVMLHKVSDDNKDSDDTINNKIFLVAFFCCNQLQQKNATDKKMETLNSRAASCPCFRVLNDRRNYIRHPN